MSGRTDLLEPSKRSARRAWWSALLAGVLALALGMALGWALLASHQMLPDLGPLSSPLIGQVGSLLLPLAGMGLLLVVGLANPLAALLLWLVLAPYSAHIPLDISLGSGIPDLSLTRLMTAGLPLLLLTLALAGRQRLRPLHWSDLVYVLFIAAMLLAAPQSRWGAPLAFQAIFDAYLVPFVGLHLARQVVRNERDLGWVMAALLAVGFGLALLIVREQITGEILLSSKTQAAAYTRSLRKVLSLMGNAAPMGVTTALTLPLGLLALVWAWSRAEFAGRNRPALVVLLALVNGFIALGVFLSYNRASWLGALLAILVPVALRPAARRLLLPVLLVAVLLVAIFWQSVIASPAVSERLLQDNSLDYRTTAITLGLEMVRGQPLLGLGYGNFGFEALETYGWNPHDTFNSYAASHNSYLFVAVSAGLAALLPYVAWLGLVAWGGIRRYTRPRRSAGPETAVVAVKRDVLAAGAALYLAYVLATATFDNAQAFYMNLVFFVALGAVWGATEEMQNAEYRMQNSEFRTQKRAQSSAHGNIAGQASRSRRRKAVRLQDASPMGLNRTRHSAF